MVVLEAAAITAAGYGLYKGGEAGVKKGKEFHKEYKREQNRSIQSNELSHKTRARSERIAKLVQMRTGKGSTSNSDSASAAVGSSCNSKNTDLTSAQSSMNDTTANNSSSVEDRHQAVMAKLRAGRLEEARKLGSSRGVGGTKGAGRFNPFKRK